MIIERTLYFAKPGKASDVLEVRRRGCEVRVALGLSAGTIYVRHGDSDAPDVQWECHFHTEEEQRADLEARGASAAFTAIREEMTRRRCDEAVQGTGRNRAIRSDRVCLRGRPELVPPA